MSNVTLPEDVLASLIDSAREGVEQLKMQSYEDKSERISHAAYVQAAEQAIFKAESAALRASEALDETKKTWESDFSRSKEAYIEGRR